jgi:hypothetical protein
MPPPVVTSVDWAGVWLGLTDRQRAAWLTGFVSMLIFALFIGLSINWVAALLAPAVYFLLLARSMYGAHAAATAEISENGAVATTASSATASTTTYATISDAGLGPGNERVEQRTRIVGRGMTREQLCAFICQRIQQHGFLRVSAEITTYRGQSGALLYMVTIDGHVPPPPQLGVSSAWPPP